LFGFGFRDCVEETFAGGVGDPLSLDAKTLCHAFQQFYFSYRRVFHNGIVD
jgi:hypothetical protein